MNGALVSGMSVHVTLIILFAEKQDLVLTLELTTMMRMKNAMREESGERLSSVKIQMKSSQIKR